MTDRIGSEAVSATTYSSTSETILDVSDVRSLQDRCKVLEHDNISLLNRLTQSEAQRALLVAENKRLRDELSKWIDLPF